MPKVKKVPKSEWEQYTPPFDSYEAVRIKHDGQGGYDYYVNIDNAFLITELNRAKDETKPQVRFWFESGLVISAVGMIKHHRQLAEQLVATSGNGRHDPEEPAEDLEQVNAACNGLARVIVPLIGSLGRVTVDS
jgi:hypothetical protein